MKNSNKLTIKHYELLMDIKNGADIFSYVDARECREIKKLEPSYIEITTFMGEYAPQGKLPYFGAIATSEGILAARKVLSTDKKIAYL